MNARLHRVIFNAARGLRMVVQETATSNGKGASKSTGGSSGASGSVAGWALLATLAAIPAAAQIVADPSAPGRQRATVLSAPNGVPLVNIQSPSAAGVSRNTFVQFDVNANGALLNNSRTNTATQLGGLVQGNPYLATGPARVILNEVNSSNPSHLRGFVEVAGTRAEVILANPAGIQVDGGGFINASKVTLTTGTAQFNAGAIEGFLVRGGTVVIDGKGLDLSRTDYAAILSRALNVNAGIWANNLKVVTGTNQISADASQITPTTGTGPAPAFTLDVAALGGMYSGKIVLVGSEAGVGVRNAGTLSASATNMAAGQPALSGVGEFVITAAGRLENTGTLQAAANAALTATGLGNSGKLTSATELRITTQGDLANTLGGTGGTLESARLVLASTAGDIDNRHGATIRQTGAAALTLIAPNVSNTAGGVIGPAPAPVTPGTGTGTGSTPSTGTGATATTDGVGGTTGTLTPTGPGATSAVPPTPGTLTAAGTVRNDGGRIHAGGTIDLQAQSLNNAGGTLAIASLAVNQPSFSNAGGTLRIAQAFSADVGHFDNTGGHLDAGRLRIATTGDLLNTDGTLNGGEATLTVGGNLSNVRGRVSTPGALTATVAGALDNTAGTLGANQTVAITAQSLDNTAGSIYSAQAGVGLNVTGLLRNDRGSVSAATDLGLQAGTLDNASGALRAGRDATVTVAGILGSEGRMTAGRHTTVTAASLHAGAASVLGAGVQGDGRPGATGDLTVSTTGALTAQGQNLAAGAMALTGSTVDLTSSQTTAAAIAITATQGDVTTSGATVATPGTLAIAAHADAGQTLVNATGTLSANQLDLQAANIANTQGGRIVQTGAGATTIATGTLNNTGGHIASNGQDLHLQATTLTNTGGEIAHAGVVGASGTPGTLTLDTARYSGVGGTLIANGALAVRASGTFDQDGGTTSARQITMDVGRLSNRAGKITQSGTGATRIAAAGALDNASGTIATNGDDLALGAGATLTNTLGTITHAGTGTFALDAASYSGERGTLASNGALVVHTGAFDQDSGTTSAARIAIDAISLSNRNGRLIQTGTDSTRIAVTGLLDNTSGVVASNARDMTVAAGAFVNTSGRLEHAGSGVLDLTVATLRNAQGQILGNGMLGLHGGDLNNDSGTITAKQIGIDAASLSNQAGGKITQTGTGDTHIAVTGALDNRAGTIASNGLNLTLAAGTLTDTAGTIAHAGTGALDITATALSNAQGQIVGNGVLGLHGGDLNNNSGTITAGQVTIDAASLSNRAGKITQTGTADTHIAVTGALDNNAGTIASNGNTTVATASLSNQGGAIRAAGTADLALTVTGRIDNSASGQLGAGGNTTLVAGTLNNDAGRITAVGDLNATVSGAASNVAGTLAANGSTAVTAASLNNASGTIAAVAVNGSLSVTTSGATTNAGGTLQAAGSATLSNAGLDNTAGKVVGNTLTIDTHGTTLTNTGGTLAGTTTLVLDSGVLNNDTGLIQSGGAMNVDTHGQQLTNTHAAGYANGQGGLTSGGTLSLSTGALDNSAGFIGATASLTASTGTFTNANGGLIVSQGALGVNTNGAAYNNQGGQTQAVGDLTINAGTGALDNTSSLIRSGGTTTLNAGTVNNASTRGPGQGIEGANVAITTATLINSLGAIRSDANTTITSAGTINNAGGLITAQGNLSLLDPHAASLGTNPTAKTLTVINTGGTLAASQSLVLDAAHFSGDGQLAAGLDLSLALTQDITNNATVQANRNLSYATTGTLTNNGTLHAGNTLTVSGADVINNAGAEMSAGQSTRITAANTLTNRGLIDGVDTQINAATLNNLGTGRIYGDHLSIAAGTLNNAPESVNGVTTAATIAARNKLDIGAGTINNSDGALIYSAGDMFIGGALDGNRNAIRQANAINNSSATIESMGNMSLAAVAIRNTNPHLVVGTQQVSSAHVNMILPQGWSTPLPASDFVSTNGHLYQKAHPAQYQTRQPAVPATVVTPGACNGDSGCDPSTSTSEAANSPRFAQFGVTPPVVRALPVASDYGCTDFGWGMSCTNPAQGAAYSTALSAAQTANAASYQTALASLTTAIDIYNAQVTEDNRLTDVGHRYTHYSYDNTVTRDVITAGGDRGAIISAGGNLALHGLLTNQDSSVTAGGTLSADQSPGNTQTQGQQVESFTGGTATSYAWKYHGGFRDSYSLDNKGVTAYGPAPTVTTYPLSNGVYQGGLNTATARPMGAGTGTSGPVQSAGAGQANAANRSSVITEVAANVGGVAPASGTGAAPASGAAAASASGGGAGAASGTGVTAVNGTSGAGSTSAAPTFPIVIRTSTPNLTLPTASLFHTNALLTGHPLVETDPRFTNMRQWLSSDYLLNALGYAPDNVQKRLGDGFYEQQLIDRQINQLTGYRFLSGFDNDQDQYSALMNAGATFARAYGLRPGIALTAAQMAQLTSDIVWLVSQSVTLPDGSTRTVLVPQVYVRVKPGDIDGSGALLSADRMAIKGAPGAGDLTNSGTIAGRSLVAITSDNINNLGGRLTGGTVALTARNDLNNLGGSITGANAVTLSAGHDINIASTTQSTTGVNAANTQTNLDRVAGVYVTNPAGVLVASAGNDVNVIGAILSNTGAGSQTQIKAGHDIDLGTLTTGQKTDVTWDAKNYLRTASSQDIGSQIVGAGSVALSAANDINARAADVVTGDTLAVIAGRNVNITAGEASQSLDVARYEKRSGFLSSSSTMQRDTVSQVTVLGSNLNGKNVVVSAGNDLVVSGSQIVAQSQVVLSAGRDVRIESAEEHASQSNVYAHSEKGVAADIKTGISWGTSSLAQNQAGQSTKQIGSTISGANISIDGGRDAQILASTVVADRDIAITAGRNIDMLAAQDTSASQTASSHQDKTIGLHAGLAPRYTQYANARSSQNGTGEASSAATSLISANGGNLTMVAGLDAQYKGTGQGNVNTQGADLLAKDNVTLTGNAVNLDAATSDGSSTHHAETRNHTIGAALAGIVGGAITKIYDLSEEAKRTDDSRLQGALALKAGYDAYKLANSGALQNGIADVGAAGTGGDPSGAAFAVSVSESRSHSSQNSTEGYSNQRGTNIQAGSIAIVARESDVTTYGAKLQANDISLDAARDINLLAAENTARIKSTNSGGSFGGGVTFGFGSQNGISFQGSIAHNSGKANGDEIHYDNTLVTATNTLTVKSGGDTTLKGAQLAAGTVKADIGGNLNVESLQDRTNYESQQTSGGLDVSICVPPICYGQVVTATLALADQSVDHNYQSATGQSGIAAGSGGFDVKVKGNTDLKGGAITSTASADRNSFTTASLTTSDLTNAQTTSASSDSLSLSYGSSASMAANAARSAAGTALSNLNSGKGLPGDRDETSQTVSVISPATIRVTGTGNATADAQSQTNAATLTGRDAGTANGALINNLTLQQAQDIPRQQQEAAAHQRAAQLVGSVVDTAIGDAAVKYGWSDGSTEKITLHALSGIVQAKIGDGSALAGAAVGALTEATAPAMAVYLKTNGYDYEDTSLTPEQRARKLADFNALMEAGSTVAGAAVGALTAGSAGAGTGANVANNATVNNFLKHAQAQAMKAEFDKCTANSGGCTAEDVKRITGKYTGISKANIDAVTACIVAGDAACVKRLESDVATASEVDTAIPFGYGSISTMFQGWQNNVNNLSTVGGSGKLGGTDVQQAEEAAKFRQDNCAGIGKNACDVMVNQAIDDRATRALVLTAVGIGVPIAAKGALSLVRPSVKAVGIPGEPNPTYGDGDLPNVYALQNATVTRPLQGASIADVAGSTVFTMPRQSQIVTGQNAGVRLGAWGESLADDVIQQLSPGAKPLQNAKGNGADAIGGTIDTVNKTIPAFEVKATDTGNRQSVDAPKPLPERMFDWVEAAATGSLNGQKLSSADTAYAASLDKLLKAGYTIKAYVVEVAVPPQGQTARPTVMVTPWPVPKPTPRPRTAP